MTYAMTYAEFLKWTELTPSLAAVRAWTCYNYYATKLNYKPERMEHETPSTNQI